MSESLSTFTSSAPMSSASSSAGTARPRVAIVGGGVIGLALAWKLARADCAVDLFEAGATGQGASRAAAGMLAACAEAEPGEEGLLALNRESQTLWPRFAAELEAESGFPVDLRTEGTLTIALTADDLARLRHLYTFQTSLGLPVEWLSATEVRRREPYLSPKLAGGIFTPADHQVDNRKVAAALKVAAQRTGARLHERTPVAKVETAGGRVSGVVAAGSLHAADVVILAAGAWSRGVPAAPATPLPVRPIKGQMLSLRMDTVAPILNHVLWAPNAYLVPRRDGRLIIGATTEEKGFDASLTAGGQLALLTNAWRALPTLEELPIAEQWVGFRPGSRDDAPILGPSPEVEGLVYATGHHRNGILLLPVTTAVISDFVLDGRMAPVAAAFGVDRFLPRAAAE
ncbi:glycine oxidase ThiO [Xanthobacter dioxanivorans]|uniref:Glycine oxidase ThiO n=1 Tax=Xanthobacter dioxanivorans TaxID=2528964 RepID=A0A974SK20_9HYPH|nr:glycine oxidase ThiO [Xanthobacter dioxanivorans]QRG08365.1 glycine oxidase ThiO [Xanthobacter dioxanivorans]